MRHINKVRINCALLLFSLLFGIFFGWNNSNWLSNCKSIVTSYLKNRDVSKVLWSKGFQLEEITSSIDGKIQRAYFYPSTTSTPQPLVVSLHTWSGTYQEFDSLAIMCKEKNLNYIRPNFRGANKTSEACLSPLVIGDIDDAIDFAIRVGNVEPSQIYIIGKSGGGYAALGAFMKSRHEINSVSSWVPITDLIKWYSEGLIRQSRYTNDILKCTTSNNNILNLAVAKERSPIYWTTPTGKRKDTKLSIFTGIYDGIQGSVPITHSIDFYNKVVANFGALDSLNYVSEEEQLRLLKTRVSLGQNGKISKRNILLKKNT